MWNLTWTDSLYTDSLVATGKRLTFRSCFMLQGKDGVIVSMKEGAHLVWHC